MVSNFHTAKFERKKIYSFYREFSKSVQFKNEYIFFFLCDKKFILIGTSTCQWPPEGLLPGILAFHDHLSFR